MEVLEKKIAEMTEDLNDLTFGSEEYERASNAIAAMTKANADDKKAENEAKNKKTEKWTAWITAGAAVITASVGVLREVLKRRTNKDVLKTEEYDVVTSKAFDNR